MLQVYIYILIISSFALGFGPKREMGLGAGSLQVPKSLQNTQIEDKTGSTIPLDLTFTNHLGQKVQLKEYLKSQKPVLISLGYYACPMLCNLVLNGLLEGQKDLGLKLGKDYHILSFSIDPKETFELAAQKRKTYLASMGIDQAPWNIWPFHVGEEKQIHQLAKALGFHYKKDEKTGDYAHGAGIFVVSPKGVLTRTLYGIEFPKSTLKMALMESSLGTLGNPLEKIMLSCFHYDPDSRKYGFYIMGIMRLGGVFILLLMMGFLLFFWMREMGFGRGRI